MAEQGVQQLGNFKLIKKLGEGGMGAVFLAEDLSLKRQVALKVLPKKFSSDKDLAARFRREAKAAGQLNHANIVGAFAVGEDAGYSYYVMEYCDGEPLDRRLKRERTLQINDALDIMTQVAKGLQYAHQQKFVHRDIKPANIVMTKDGVAKILDLGLSKNMADSAQSYNTLSGQALGTPHYISPEQARGQQDIDGRADIYSLGCTLYHFMTGLPPFDAATAAVIMMKHLNEPFPSVVDKRPDLPLGVVHIITKATYKDPAERYRDCAELLRDLERVSAGQPPVSTLVRHTTGKAASAVKPRRNNTSERVPEQGGQKIPMAAVGIVIAAVLVAGIILFSGGNDDDVANRENKTTDRKPVADAGPVHKQPVPVMPAPGPNPRPPAAPATKAGKSPEELAQAAFDALNALPESERAAAAEAFLSKHGDSIVASRARLMLNELRPTKAAAAPQVDANAAVDTQVDAPARWANAVDLLALADPQRDFHTGQWSRTNAGIRAERVSNSDRGERMQLPYIPPEEYDFRVEFTREEGKMGIGHMFPSPLGDERFFAYQMGALRNSCFLIYGLAGDATNNPTMRMAPQGALTNGQRYVSVLQVRKNLVRAYLDGKIVLDYPTNYAPQPASTFLELQDKRCLGLTSIHSRTVFHKIQVLEITGKGTALQRPTTPQPTPASVSTASAALSEDLSMGAAVNLLPMVKPELDQIDSKWQMDGNSRLTSDNNQFAKLGLPYRPPEEYDLRATFTRNEGDADVVLMLAAGGKQFSLMLGAISSAGERNCIAGFDLVDNLPCNKNSTTTRDAKLSNGTRHAAIVKVRRNEISAYLDGRLLRNVKTDYGNFSMRGRWQLRETGVLGLGSFGNSVTFHSLDIVELTGNGACLRTDAASSSVSSYLRYYRNDPMHAGRWERALELLPLIDPGKDQVMGEWEKKDGILICRPKIMGANRLVVPYKPPEEYDLKMTFSRDAGNQWVCLIGSYGERQFMWVMAWDNMLYGIDTVEGARSRSNTTTQRRENLIVNNRKHTTILSVRKNRITIYLDGSQILEYPASFQNLTLAAEAQKLGMDPLWRLPAGAQLGIGTSLATTVYSVQLAPLNGPGEPLRPNDPAARELTAKPATAAAESNPSRTQPAAATPASVAQPASTAVELLPLVDVSKDGVNGKWELQNGVLSLRNRDSAPRLAIPFKPTEEYDLKMTFSRDSGTDAVCLIASCLNRPFMWVMGWENKFYGLDTIDGVRGRERANPTMQTRENMIVNGKRHTAVLSVRRNKITVTLDGVSMVDYPANNNLETSKLGMAAQWEMPAGTRLGIAATEPITVYSLQFTAVSGKGEPTRPDDRAARELVQPTPELDSKVFYEQTFAEALPLLTKRDYKTAAQKFDAAGRKPEAAAVRDALQLDVEMAAWPEQMDKALREAATALKDGQPFTLVRKAKPKNEIISVAKGKPDSVVDVTNDHILLKQTVGGSVGNLPVRFETLAPETRDELIKRGLPPGIESEIKLLYYPTIDLLNNIKTRSENEVRALLTTAAKDPTHGHKARHMLSRLEAADLEERAQKAYPLVEAVLKTLKVQDSVDAFAAFKRDFNGTLCFAKHQAELEKRVGELTATGMWAMFYEGENKAPSYSCLIQNFDKFKFDETKELVRICSKPFRMRLRATVKFTQRDGIRLFARYSNGTLRAHFNKNQTLFDQPNYVELSANGRTGDATAAQVEDARRKGFFIGGQGLTLDPDDYEIEIEFVCDRQPALELRYHRSNTNPATPFPAEYFKHEVGRRKDYENEPFKP